MEASDLFHDIAALFQAKQHQRPLTTRLGGPHSPSAPPAEEAYLCVPSATDRISFCTARGLFSRLGHKAK
jgi:hypothetical protein